MMDGYKHDKTDLAELYYGVARLLRKMDESSYTDAQLDELRKDLEAAVDLPGPMLIGGGFYLKAELPA